MSQPWYATDGKTVYGPYTLAQMRAFTTSGRIQAHAKVRSGESGAWIKAGEAPGLFDDDSDFELGPVQPAEQHDRHDIVLSFDDAEQVGGARPSDSGGRRSGLSATPSGLGRSKIVPASEIVQGSSNSAMRSSSSASGNLNGRSSSSIRSAASGIRRASKSSGHSRGGSNVYSSSGSSRRGKRGRQAAGLGEVSVGLALVALAFYWKPRIAVPLSYLGLVVGGCGMLTALFRTVGGGRFGAPIAGVWASLAVRMVLGLLVPAGGGKAIASLSSAPGGVVTAAAETDRAVSHGAMEVQIESVTVDHVRFKIATTEAVSKDKLLAIRLSVANRSMGRTSYNGWNGVRTAAVAATLHDADRHPCKQVSFGAEAKIVGQLDRVLIDSHGTVHDLLVFELPANLAGELLLELPAGAINGTGALRFKISPDFITGR